MRICIVGAGVQGSAIALISTKIREVDEIICSDLNLDRAKRVVEILRSDKVRAERTDASDPSDLRRVSNGADVVMCATPPRLNLNVMHAALNSGAHYVDLATDDPLQELELNDRWSEAGLTAVIAQGGPFIMNVLVRRIADELDLVEEIELRFGWRIPRKEVPSAWTPAWCPEAALDEWVREPLVFENGSFRRVPRCSGKEDYDFPDPVGRLTVCLVDYEPTYTLPRFIGKGIRHVNCKIPPDEMALALIEMGLAGKSPIEVGGVRVVPRDLLLALTPPPADLYHGLLSVDPKDLPPNLVNSLNVLACYLTEVKGEKGGEKSIHTAYRISNFLENLKKHGTPWAEVAIPATVTALMLAKGEVKIKGVIPPECLDPDRFLARLERWGITFREFTKKQAAGKRIIRSFKREMGS